jgi:hypothetical protein
VNERVKVSVKKVYQEPSLRVYGDIRVLTQGGHMARTIVDAKGFPGGRKSV